MSSNDLVYTKESLVKDAADFAANAPVFLPVPDVGNTSPNAAADLSAPVYWHTTKTGRVYLTRQGKQHLIEFYALVNDELILGYADRRWIFNTVIDTITIKAPLKTADLSRLESYAQMMFERDSNFEAL